MIKFTKLSLEEIDASYVRDEFVLYDTSSSDYRYQMAEDEEFYLGEQLTEAQKIIYIVLVNQLNLIIR